MGGYLRAEKRAAEEARRKTAELPLLPDDVTENESGLLEYIDGSRVPDGLYRREDGSVFMYEGNFGKTTEGGFLGA